MADEYQTNNLGIRAIVRGTRIIKPPGKVRIGGHWFGSWELSRHVGRTIEVAVYDNLATEYHARLDDGTGLGTIKDLTPRTVRSKPSPCFICGKPIRGVAYTSATGRAHKKCMQ
jgi:hypothetical protein